MPTSLTIIGNAADAAKVHKTNAGTEIVELRIASQDGKDKTSWWTAKFIGNKAGEIAAKYVKKGSSVIVTGFAEEETWEKEGEKKSKIVCIATSFAFGQGSKGGGEKATAPKPKAAQQQQQEEQNGLDDDCPF